jgi:hypothetical protein
MPAGRLDQAARSIVAEGFPFWPKMFIASGIVVMAPTATSVHPAARRWSLFNLLDNNKPIPAPNIPRVLAIRAISDNVSFRFFTWDLLSYK